MDRFSMQKLKSLKVRFTMAAVFGVAFYSYAVSEESPFPYDPIHPINYVKIQNGMSVNEVEAILGKERILGSLSGYVGPNTWWGTRYIIHIHLDMQDLVKSKTIEMHRFVRPTMLDYYYKLIYRL